MSDPVVIPHKYKLRGGLASLWASKDPVLGLHEPGHEVDTNRLKIGDGVKKWSQLPYLVDVTAISTLVTNLVNAALEDLEIGTVTWGSIPDKPTTFPPSTHSHSEYQTASQVDSRADARIGVWVGAAPAAFDTLVEIAAQLANDSSAITALTNAISLKASAQSVSDLAASVSQKASAQSVADVVASISDLATSLSQKASLQSVIDLTSELASKASISSVSALATEMTSKASIQSVTNLSNELSSKASTSALDDLSTTVSQKASAQSVANLTSTVNDKADRTELVTLSNDTYRKAVTYSKTEVDTLISEIPSGGGGSDHIVIHPDYAGLKLYYGPEGPAPNPSSMPNTYYTALPLPPSEISFE